MLDTNLPRCLCKKLLLDCLDTGSLLFKSVKTHSLFSAAMQRFPTSPNWVQVFWRYLASFSLSPLLSPLPPSSLSCFIIFSYFVNLSSINPTSIKLNLIYIIPISVKLDSAFIILIGLAIPSVKFLPIPSLSTKFICYIFYIIITTFSFHFSFYQTCPSQTKLYQIYPCGKCSHAFPIFWQLVLRKTGRLNMRGHPILQSYLLRIFRRPQGQRSHFVRISSTYPACGSAHILSYFHITHGFQVACVFLSLQ